MTTSSSDLPVTLPDSIGGVLGLPGITHATRLQHVRAEGERGGNEFQLMVRQGESTEAQP